MSDMEIYRQLCKAPKVISTGARATASRTSRLQRARHSAAFDDWLSSRSRSWNGAAGNREVRSFQQLETRKLVERAKGILQRDLGLTEEQAYLSIQRQVGRSARRWRKFPRRLSWARKSRAAREPS